MKTTEPDLLQVALDEVDLFAVARALDVELRMGAQRSPFREDKHPSFSVYARDGKTLFKDHKTDEKGGAWSFVKLAKPDWQNRHIAEFIMGLNGRAPGPAKPHKPPSPQTRIKKAYRERDAALTRVNPLPVCQPWDEFIRDRYAEGFISLRDDSAARSRLAQERGWPEDWVTDLWSRGLFARPWLPWADAGTPGSRRGVAFMVSRPIGEGQGKVALETVGYHQRYFTGSGSKAWIYAPYVPREEKARSTFQVALRQLGRTIPAFPFVMGNLDNPRLVVILEGQWDAITFFYLAGLPGIAVFGMRGASSVEVFLAAYGRWLKACAPVVWLLPDADDAGRRWTIAEHQPGRLTRPTFRDRLHAFGVGRVVVDLLSPESGSGKDFNDFYTRRNIDEQWLRRWMEKKGIKP